MLYHGDWLGMHSLLTWGYPQQTRSYKQLMWCDLINGMNYKQLVWCDLIDGMNYNNPTMRTLSCNNLSIVANKVIWILTNIDSMVTSYSIKGGYT